MQIKEKENSVKNKSSILFVILAFLLFISTSVAVLLTLELNAANRLLNKLTLAKPGIHISQIRQELGIEMREASDPEEIILWGRVKNESFCKDKKLYWFYVSTPPCRILEIYTDTNDLIVYVTWSGL
jgi:hypothetical protein